MRIISRPAKAGLAGGREHLPGTNVPGYFHVRPCGTALGSHGAVDIAMRVRQQASVEWAG